MTADRDKFEIYAANQGLRDFERNEFDDYRNPFTQQPWCFWKASRDAMTQAPAEAHGDAVAVVEPVGGGNVEAMLLKALPVGTKLYAHPQPKGTAVAWEVKQGARTLLVPAAEFVGKSYDAAAFRPLVYGDAQATAQPKDIDEAEAEAIIESLGQHHAAVKLLESQGYAWNGPDGEWKAPSPAPGAESEEALLAAMHKLEDVYFKRGLPAFETAAEHVQHAAELIALGTQSDETAWLLETNGGGHALYWDGGLWIGDSPRISGVMQFGLTTTKDAGKAVRFVSRELAEAALKSFRADYRVAIGGAGVWKAAEHMWPASQAPAVAHQPLTEAQVRDIFRSLDRPPWGIGSRVADARKLVRAVERAHRIGTVDVPVQGSEQ